MHQAIRWGVVVALLTTASTCGEPCGDDGICLTMRADTADPELAAVSSMTVVVSGSENFVATLVPDGGRAAFFTTTADGVERTEYKPLVRDGTPLMITAMLFDAGGVLRGVGRVETTATEPQSIDMHVTSDARY